MRVFCARRKQVGLIYEVQIAVINGEITSAKYTFYLKNPPESYEARKDDENFWKVVDMAVDLLSSETKVYNDMWGILSPEFVEILHSHKIYRGGDWERFSKMTVDEIQEEMEEMERKNPKLKAAGEWYERKLEQNRRQRKQPIRQAGDIEKDMKEGKKIADSIMDLLKGESLL